MSLLTQASLVLTPNAVKASKLYSVVPSNGNGDMDVVRATTATRTNSLGLIESVASNVARLNYEAGSPSILVEPQRTNLLTYSEMFSTVWTANDLNTSGTPAYINQGISPDNALTADKIIPNTVTGTHRFISPTITVVSGSAYTFSVFMKKNDFDFCYFRENINGTTDNTFFNLSTITLGTVASGRTAKIENYGNGWIRCSVTATTTTTSITVLGIGVTNTNGIIAIIGDNVKFNFLWGAQLELGAYLTSYIPTTTASVTRNADIISKTGISDLIGQTEGVVFLDFALRTNGSFEMDFGINNGTTTDLIGIFNVGLKPYVGLKSNNVQIFLATTQLNNMVIGVNSKIAIAYKNNDFAIYQDGVQKFTQSSGNVPINLNFLSVSSTAKFYTIRNVMLFKTRLTNTELAQLTTL